MKEPMKPDSARLERIAHMEEIYDRSVEAVEAVLRAVEAYAEIKAELSELEAYYTSPLWLADFDADRAGEIPGDMKRGILTEDAIWNLLTDQARMMQELSYLIKENADKITVEK